MTYFESSLVRISIDISFISLKIALYSKTYMQNGHSKIDNTKILMTNGSLMKVKSIAECSLGAFCNTFDMLLQYF